MKILSVESSCDETAVAVVEDGRTILTDCIASQVALHRLYGGVVPELASRKHIEAIYALAANMIGVNKRIIAFDNIGTYMVMFNPVIVKKSAPYDAEEGCLSLTGTRKTKRYQTIKVQWQNEQFQTRIKTFTGWAAQIIQHEIDHCEGILI